MLILKYHLLKVKWLDLSPQSNQATFKALSNKQEYDGVAICCHLVVEFVQGINIPNLNSTTLQTDYCTFPFIAILKYLTKNTLMCLYTEKKYEHMLHTHTYHIRRTFTVKMKKHAIMFKNTSQFSNRPSELQIHCKSVLCFDIYPETIKI